MGRAGPTPEPRASTVSSRLYIPVVRGAETIELPAFRDHLREVQSSLLMADFTAGRRDWRAVLSVVSGHLRADLGLAYDFETLGPPRDVTHLENYLQRSEWQYYKTSAREADFRALIGWAQHDPRYLRAVSRTSRRRQDPRVENHNLPMGCSVPWKPPPCRPSVDEPPPTCHPVRVTSSGGETAQR